MNKQTEALKMSMRFAEANSTTRISTMGKDDALTGQEVFEACKEALEQPAQEYLTRAQQVIRANNSAQEPVAWIKVKDKLPEFKTEVMTWGVGTASNEFECCQAYYSESGWQELDCCGDFFEFEPSHWMPIPNEPKE